jgi:NitT/TauT family transport system substrate-binding protein/putative hydroxymethylpyrimidine transport system substrate-binding protein
MFTALLLSAALVACGSGGESGRSGGGSPVTVALDFVPNAAHAGIYAGREGGSGRPPLTVRVPSGSTDSVKLLLGRRADLAVVDIHDLGLARERGEDIVGVGALVQRPLAAVIARSDIARPRDLEGKRVGIAGLPSDEAVLRAVVENDGGDYDKVRKITIGFAAVKALAAGKVDAVIAFWNVEGVTLRREGVPTREFRVDDYGAPSYPELVLAVRGEELRSETQRKRIAGALDSIGEGTRTALREPRDAIATVAEASQSDPGLVTAEMDAIRPALSPPVKLDRAQLEAWGRWDARFGILNAPPDIGKAFVTP